MDSRATLCYPAAMPSTINLLDSTAISVLLMNAICEQVPIGSPQWDQLANTRDLKTPGVVEIALIINGVTIVDPVQALTTVINREMARRDELASARALEMVSDAGLNGVAEAHSKLIRDIESARYELRRVLRDKAGATFCDDDCR